MGLCQPVAPTFRGVCPKGTLMYDKTVRFHCTLYDYLPILKGCRLGTGTLGECKFSVPARTATAD